MRFDPIKRGIIELKNVTQSGIKSEKEREIFERFDLFEQFEKMFELSYA